MTNKLLFFIAFIFFGQIAIGQVDTRTKNQVRAKFEIAKDYYADKEYTSTLKKLEEIEGLMNGTVIPTAQSLKVATLLKLKRYKEAKKELVILENLELSITIINEVTQYTKEIEAYEKHIADLELKRKKEQLEKERLELIRKEEARKKNQLEEEKERERLISLSSVTKINIDSEQKYNSFLNEIDYYSNLQELSIRPNFDWKYTIGINETTFHNEKLGNLDKLTKLFIFSASLKEIPDWIGKLSNLQVLSFENNRLSSIPEFIGNLTQLRSLDISGNRIENLPQTFLNLKKLRSLYLSYVIPEIVMEIKNLNKLEVSNLDNLQPSIAKLTNLKHLWLYKYNSALLPESIGELINLEKLIISDSELLSGLPESISKLNHLELISLDDNNLTTIPKPIFRVTSLKFLDVEGNQITKISKNIGNLTNLIRLDISNNNITKIPSEIGLLNTLYSLDIRGNPTIKLPKSMKNLSKLKKLILPKTISNYEKVLPDNYGLQVKVK
ncbi:leucine-rich repeat domain-containing protein [Mangrovimonas cancribranchiae]|uniref:Leucine-rich repeat domain-containing protein n=1 Tax=Mangrovimonas cancribranchiae TaxID=3080055 RepID=A0AAU6NWH3_9FLAO